MTYFDKMVKEYRRNGLPKLVIHNKRVPHQWNTYSGIKRIKTKCITYHNSGIDGVSAWGSHNWIKNYSPKEEDKVSWAGTINYDASIWQHGEWDDLFWASGTAPSNQYTSLAVGEYNSRPYDYDIPFEFSTINNTGEPGFCGYINDAQLVAGALIGVKLLKKFDLAEPSKGTLQTHYAFAKNKPYCPKFLIDPDNWRRFINMGDDFYDIFTK